MNQEIVITIDKGIPLPDDKIRHSHYAKYKEKLLAMAIGDSFFLEHTTKDEVGGLIRHAKRLNVHLLAVDLEEDPDYLEPGVRLWRVEQDQLPGRKPAVKDKDDEILGQINILFHGFKNGMWEKEEFVSRVAALSKTLIDPTKAPPPTYWHNGTTDEYFIMPPFLSGHTEEGDTIEVTHEGYQKGLERKRAQAEQTSTETYWKDMQKMRLRICKPGTTPPTNSATKWEQITKDEHDQLKTDWEDDLPCTYWRKPKPHHYEVREFLPGKAPDENEGWTPATKYDYELSLTIPAGKTYWRRVDGSCVEVGPEKYLLATKTKGAIQIKKTDFNKWLKEQQDSDL